MHVPIEFRSVRRGSDHLVAVQVGNDTTTEVTVTHPGLVEYFEPPFADESFARCRDSLIADVSASVRALCEQLGSGTVSEELPVSVVGPLPGSSVRIERMATSLTLSPSQWRCVTSVPIDSSPSAEVTHLLAKAVIQSLAEQIQTALFQTVGIEKNPPRMLEPTMNGLITAKCDA